MLVHNILPLRGRLASLGGVADGACGYCGGWEDVAHFFQHCPESPPALTSGTVFMLK
jgi:hypothetical protein